MVLQLCALQACKVCAFWQKYCAECLSFISILRYLFSRSCSCHVEEVFGYHCDMREAVTAASLLKQASDTIYEWY